MAARALFEVENPLFEVENPLSTSTNARHIIDWLRELREEKKNISKKRNIRYYIYEIIFANEPGIFAKTIVDWLCGKYGDDFDFEIDDILEELLRVEEDGLVWRDDDDSTLRLIFDMRVLKMELIENIKKIVVG